MALDFCQKFVSTQYLENKWIEFQLFLHMHLYKQYLGWYCDLLFETELQPLIDVRILFLLNVFRFSCSILLDLFTEWKALDFNQILWQF